MLNLILCGLPAIPNRAESSKMDDIHEYYSQTSICGTSNYLAPFGTPVLSAATTRGLFIASIK